MCNCLFAIAILGFSSMAPASTLTFEEAVALLSDSQTAAKVDDAERDAAAARARAAWQVYLPEVSASATRSVTKQDLTPTNAAMVDLDLNLFRFGADRAESKAGFAANEIAIKRHELGRRSREFSAGRLLLAFLHAIKLRDAESQFLEIRSKNLELTKKLYDRGLKSGQDVSALEIDMTTQRSSLVERESAVDSALAAIASTSPEAAKILNRRWQLGWPWAQAIQTKEASAFRQALPQRTLALSLAEQEREEAAALYAKALSEGLPTLGLNWDNRWARDEVKNSELKRTWTASVTVSVPIYQRGINSADRAAAHAKIAAADQLINHRRNESASKFDLFKRQLDRNADLVQSHSATSGQARKLYEHSLAGFQRGVISVNDLATDQVRFLDSEKAAINSWYQSHLAMIDLCELIELPLQACTSSSN